MIVYEELDGSPTETIDPTSRGFRATRVLQCDWDDRFDLVDQIVGGHEQYPYNQANFPDVRAQRATGIQGFGRVTNNGASDVAAYYKARVTIEYEQLWASVPDETIEVSGENIVTGDSSLFWNSDKQKTIDLSPAILMGSIDYVVTWQEVTTVPNEAKEFVWHCNEAAVTPTTGGLQNMVFEAETLLFHGPQARRVNKPDGTYVWTVTYKFTYRPNYDLSTTPPTAKGWNYAWRKDKTVVVGANTLAGTWDKLVVKDGAAWRDYKPYKTADFTKL